MNRKNIINDDFDIPADKLSLPRLVDELRLLMQGDLIAKRERIKEVVLHLELISVRGYHGKKVGSNYSAYRSIRELLANPKLIPVLNQEDENFYEAGDETVLFN